MTQVASITMYWPSKSQDQAYLQGKGEVTMPHMPRGVGSKHEYTGARNVFYSPAPSSITLNLRVLQTLCPLLGPLLGTWPTMGTWPSIDDCFHFSVSNLFPSLQLGTFLSSEGVGTERGDKGKTSRGFETFNFQSQDFDMFLCPPDNLHCPASSQPHRMEHQPRMSSDIMKWGSGRGLKVRSGR